LCAPERIRTPNREGALSSALFPPVLVPVLVLVVATSLAVLRTGALPRWLGLAGVVLAGLLVLILVLEAIDAFDLGSRITGQGGVEESHEQG
jgi:hypothetical protein